MLDCSSVSIHFVDVNSGDTRVLRIVVEQIQKEHVRPHIVARQSANFSRRVANRACSLWRRSARVVTIAADSQAALDDQPMAGVIMWMHFTLPALR